MSNRANAKKIIISGQTPSQKNSKQIFKNFATGASFISSSDIVKEWQKEAKAELRKYKFKFIGRVQIDYMFYVVDNAQRDLDNMIASVNDALQIANSQYHVVKGKVKPIKGTGIIQGDHWQFLRLGSADAAIDRENPRAEMIITVIDNVT